MQQGWCRGRVRRALMALSIALNEAAFGRRGETLCTRIGLRFGHDCIFCKVIAVLMDEPDHCWGDMLAEFKRRAGK